MLLVAVAMVSAITTMHFAIHGAEVKVPALKGMTVAEARSQAAGMGLNLDVDNRYYSSDVAAGTSSRNRRRRHRRPPRVARARLRKPGSAEGRRSRYGRHRCARCRPAPAPRRPSGGRNREVALARRAGQTPCSRRIRPLTRRESRSPASTCLSPLLTKPHPTDSSCPTSPACRHRGTWPAHARSA